MVTIVPITDGHLDYARTVAAHLKRADMRVRVDDGDSRMSGKIREAQVEKIPFVLVVGDKERDAGTVSVRSRDSGQLGAMTIETFLQITQGERDLAIATAIL